MKRIASVFLVLTALLLSSCTASTPPESPEAQLDTAAFLSDIKPNVECLNDCALEMFGADVDFDTIYLGAYTDENSYENGLGTVAVLYLEGEENKVADYFIDPADTYYYPVSNFETNEEVRQHLRKYMSDGVINDWFHDDFLEYQGTLYLQRGARGYGAVTIDMDSIKYVEQKEEKQYVAVDFLLFDEYDYTSILEFTKTDTGWLLTGQSQQE